MDQFYCMCRRHAHLHLQALYMQKTIKQNTEERILFLYYNLFRMHASAVCCIWLILNQYGTHHQHSVYVFHACKTAV